MFKGSSPIIVLCWTQVSEENCFPHLVFGYFIFFCPFLSVWRTILPPPRFHFAGLKKLRESPAGLPSSPSQIALPCYPLNHLPKQTQATFFPCCSQAMRLSIQEKLISSILKCATLSQSQLTAEESSSPHINIPSSATSPRPLGFRIGKFI